MTRPTARGVALLAVAVATYVAARVLGTWELYLVALAFAAMTALAWVLVLAGSRRLQVDRSVTPERPVAGDPLTFSFRVRNGWRVPGLQVTLADATGRLGGPSDPVVLEGLGIRGDRTVTAGPWPARRGVHRLPAVAAVVEDPLGLVRARRQAGEPLRVTVAPRLDELASCSPCADSGARHGGGRRRLPTRDAWEFRGIRPHDPGEPLNRVDWKATAKTGSLMLREMEAASDDDLTVLLSGAAAHDAGEPPDSSFETAVRAAGSMAAFTLSSGHAVSLLLPERDWRPVRLTPDAASRRKLLGVLAEAEPSGPPGSARRCRPSSAAGRRCAAASSPSSSSTSTTISSAPCSSCGGRASRCPWSTWRPRTAPRGGGADGARGDDRGRALAAAGARYVRLHRDDDLHTALAATQSRRPVRAG